MIRQYYFTRSAMVLLNFANSRSFAARSFSEESLAMAAFRLLFKAPVSLVRAARTAFR